MWMLPQVHAELTLPCLTDNKIQRQYPNASSRAPWVRPGWAVLHGCDPVRVQASARRDRRQSLRGAGDTGSDRTVSCHLSNNQGAKMAFLCFPAQCMMTRAQGCREVPKCWRGGHTATWGVTEMTQVEREMWHSTAVKQSCSPVSPSWNIPESAVSQDQLPRVPAFNITQIFLSPLPSP